MVEKQLLYFRDLSFETTARKLLAFSKGYIFLGLELFSYRVILILLFLKTKSLFLLRQNISIALVNLSKKIPIPCFALKRIRVGRKVSNSATPAPAKRWKVRQTRNFSLPLSLHTRSLVFKKLSKRGNRWKLGRLRFLPRRIDSKLGEPPTSLAPAMLFARI